MTIKPLFSMVQLDIKEAQAGVLNTSSRDTAVEYGEVIAVGDGASTVLKVGDKVFVKAWGIDTINYNEEKFYFVDVTSNAILAKVE